MLTIANQLGLDTIIEDSRLNQSKSLRQSLIDSIKREIRVVTERNTLELVTKESGKLEVNRFYRQSHKDKSKAIVAVKYKNKMFGFGEPINRYKPQYFSCDYNVESVIKLLNTLKQHLESLSDDNEMFKVK